MQYEIIETDSSNELAKEVNERIAAGWLPLGGVAALSYEVGHGRSSYLENRAWYCQAMTKA